MPALFVCIMLLWLLFCPPSAAADTWYKGNTHTHTTVSDGTNSPTEVAARYKNHGYDFLFLTDHNTISRYDTSWNWEHLNGQPSLYPFIINGVEMTENIHASGLGVSRPLHASTSLTAEVLAVENDGAISALNHPDWMETVMEIPHTDFTSRVITAIDTAGLNYLEVANGMVGHLEADTRFWDELLTSNRKVFGIASDDAHSVTDDNTPIFGQAGKGWIMVRVPVLTRNAILTAIHHGNFYASNGVTLSHYQINYPARTISLTSQNGSRIDFIGRNGAILKTVSGLSGSYTLTGNELYVRAVISDGTKTAWTQPVFTADFHLQPLPGDTDGNDLIDWLDVTAQTRQSASAPSYNLMVRNFGQSAGMFNPEISQYLVRGGQTWQRDKTGNPGSTLWGVWRNVTGHFTPVTAPLTAASLFKHPDGYLIEYYVKSGSLWSRDNRLGWTDWQDVTANIATVGTGLLTDFGAFVHPDGYIQQHLVRNGRLWARDKSGGGWSTWQDTTNDEAAVGSGPITSFHAYVHPDGYIQQHLVRDSQLWARDASTGPFGSWQNHSANIAAVGSGPITGFSTNRP